MCGIVQISVGKKSLYGNVRIITEIGEKSNNSVRKSDLVDIWFELASQL